MTSDPTRLLDVPEMAAGLRADLGHATAAAVTGLDTTAGLAGLKAAIATQGAAAAGSAGLLGKAMLAVVLVGSTSVIGLGMLDGTTGGDPAPPPAPTTKVAVATPPVQPEQEPAAKPQPTPEVRTPVAPAPVEVAPPEEAPEVDDAGRAKHRAVAKKKKATPADVLREARIVSDAKKALAGSPSRALSLTREAAREFPKGQLVEEREAIAIRALAKLGRNELARKRAERFLKRYSAGPHAESVRRAVPPN